jgi:hypothetical protein
MPANGVNILLQILIGHLSFRLQPVIKRMAILSAMLFIQGVRSLRDAPMERCRILVRLVRRGVLMTPWLDRTSKGMLCCSYA